MIARKAEASREMSKRGKPRAPGRRKHGLTDQMKALATSALAQKIGYLRVEDFPDAGLFDDLPTQTYSPNRIIRSQDELLLVKRGLVEVWHTHHDLLVKKLLVGTLFGDMPLLGQTMVVTQAVSGPAGATIAVMNADRVRELIKANADSMAEMFYPRLASVETEHYRAIYQKADSRVAAILLEIAGEGSTVEGVKQSQLGERIGLVRETVAVVLGSMKADKLITIDRKKTTILDRKALEKLSRL
jgi:CRP-like cAMP-binding protein